MIPVTHLVPAMLVEVLRRAPLSPEKVAFAWRHAVGPAVDRVTVVGLTGDVLEVRVRDANWKREIRRSLPVVRPRLEAVLGPGVVRAVKVVTHGEE